MKIGGQYVGLGLGDSSPEIARIKTFMRRKFSYAKQLADTELYDEQMVNAVADMQRRYNAGGQLPDGSYTSGIINVKTKEVMGYLKPPPPVDTRPLLLTVCGTGVPWWVGPDADVARAVEAQWKWQPIGYPANPFPMGKSVKAGLDELCFQCERDEPGFDNRRRIEKYGCALIGYSQGAIITSSCWEYDIKTGGRLGWMKDRVLKAVTFGNPMREQGKAYPDPGAEMAPPNSHGIADQLMADTPSWWRNYAHRSDLYTDCAGQSGEDKTAIYKIIMGERVFSGPDSLLAQFLELGTSPVVEGTAIFSAVMDAGLFFGRQTGPHVNYNTGPAIAFLRS